MICLNASGCGATDVRPTEHGGWSWSTEALVIPAALQTLYYPEHTFTLWASRYDPDMVGERSLLLTHWFLFRMYSSGPPLQMCHAMRK